jgi:lathosterol oxidase
MARGRCPFWDREMPPLIERLQRALTAIPRISQEEAKWYFLFASLAWVLFYVVLRRALIRRKISPRFPTWKQMGWELLFSLRSLVVFGVAGGFIVFCAYSGWARLYYRIEDWGWAWFVISIGLMVLLHDTYFYWTHRLMHHRRLFKPVHRIHHLSTNPSPWAAYSFSTVEAFVQAGIGPLIILTIPSHPAAFLAFMLWQIGFNVVGHCGFEIMPRWFMRSGIGKFLNTPTHHAMHHEAFRANFGLYFNVWDRLMGTNHPYYEERFEQVTGAAKA